MHSPVIFKHCALDTRWKLSYQFVNGMVMSLPEQKTVSIIVSLFYSFMKKSRIYKSKGEETTEQVTHCQMMTPDKFCQFQCKLKTNFYHLFDVAFLDHQNKVYLQTTAIWFWKCKKNSKEGHFPHKIYMVVNDFLLWSVWWLTAANKFIYNREIWDLIYKEISNTQHRFMLLAYFKQFGQPFLENKSFFSCFFIFCFFWNSVKGFDNKTANTTFQHLVKQELNKI